MSVRPWSFALPLVALVLAACQTPQFPDGQVRPGSGLEVSGGAFILTGRALTEARGSVLRAMEGRVPNMKIRRTARGCPEINIRNQIAFQRSTQPHVYVDGTRTTDTCILESLRSHDVESVEVYPLGFTRRPGYSTHAHGLILVFMRSGG